MKASRQLDKPLFAKLSAGDTRTVADIHIR